MAKADLHLHTRVSDGMASVEQLLAYVEEQTDLDVIAVTDHEDAAGGQRARELSASRGYRAEVVVGAEVTTLQGHLLALFIEEAPRSFRSIERTIEAIHAQGGLAIVPHPMSWLTRSISERTLRRLCARAEDGITFDGIELANPSPAGKATRAKAIALNRTWMLTPTGGSDAHHLAHAGTGWTEFAGRTAEDLRAAIISGAATAGMSDYPPLREVGYRATALGLVWGYAATPRKMLRFARQPRRPS